MSRQAISLVLTVPVVLAALSCRPAVAPSSAPGPRASASRGGADLTGLWVGSRRDQPERGLRRAGTLLLDLRSGSQGSLGGSLELRGELGSVRGSEGETVRCAPKPQAVVTRTAAITGGRAAGGRLRLQLAKPDDAGEVACGARFPLGERCDGRGRADGSLELTCGGETVLARRVNLTGTWVFDEEQADRSGDTVVQRLRFHLVQAGDRLTGTVDDIRVHVSGDEQNFRCNGRLRYDRQARHRLEGKLQGRQVELRVVGSVPKSGPCQGELKLPDALSGQWKPLEDHLMLKIGDDERSLWRRPRTGRGEGRNE